MAVNLYFAPTFFSPYYFPMLATASSGVGGTSADTSNDGIAFEAILSALSATNEFADVLLGTPADRAAVGADRMPVALVTPTGWTEADDSDPTTVVRRVEFTVALTVRDETTSGRYQSLLRLTAVAQDAIDGSDLGGVCLPALTLLRSARFDANPQPPEQSVAMDGEFTYLISSFNGHSGDSSSED